MTNNKINPGNVTRGNASNAWVLGSGKIINCVGYLVAIIAKMKDKIKVSMAKAQPRNQNPAYGGCTSATDATGIAGIDSGGCAFCGTYTGPIWATLTGHPQ